MSVPRAFVAPSILAAAVPGDRLALSGEAAHHLATVLRRDPGDPCSLFDGAGRQVEAQVESTGRDEMEVRVVSVRDVPPLPGPSLEVVVGLLKADKLDWVVQKLTEVGTDRIVPVYTERSVPRPAPEAAVRRHERLERILRESARQCGRAHLPLLEPMTSLANALDGSAGTGVLGILCWEEAPMDARLGRALDRALTASRVLLLVGPEGGFTSAEAELATSHGFVPASLGPLVLRSETAAVVACALAASRIGRLG